MIDYAKRNGWGAAAEHAPDALVEAAFRWPVLARPDQLPPPGDWTTWLMLGGRGAGKTRAGAEWVKGLALGAAPFADAPVGRIALVGETLGDVRDVMVEGVSGLLGIHTGRERPRWVASKRQVVWPDGQVAQAFSSEDPESLRGPQFAAAWCDELAKWKHLEATWDMLQFGLRLGERPRQVVTTTPRPIPLVKQILGDAGTVTTRAATAANRAELSPAFMQAVVARYAGTRLGRQELEAELIADAPGALWQRAELDAVRVASAPALRRIVVAVDPPASAGRDSDACGIVAAGLGGDGLGYVLHDATAGQLSPAKWARRAVELFHKLEADRIVAEVNQGGDMVEAVIRQADADVPVTQVRASRGKFVRAEPVAALLRAGTGAARRGVPAAGGRDVRLRAGRPVVGTLAGPARRTGLGAVGR